MTPQNAYPNISGGPAGDVRPPTDQRADKGKRRVGLYAIVIAAIVLGIAFVALDLAGPGEENRDKHPGGPQQTHQLNR